MAAAYAKPLQLKLQEAGLQGTLDADAFQALLKYIDHVQGDLDNVYKVLEQLKLAAEEQDILTQDNVVAAIQKLAGQATVRDLVFVVDTFKVQRIHYDPVAKRLCEDNKNNAVLAPAQAKHQLYLDRLNLLFQRLKRNRRFQAPTLMAASGQNQMHVQLSELVGLKGLVGQRSVVMGIIGTTEAGSFTLEDTGGVVPLDLSKATVAAGFVTENAVIVAEGEMGHDGVFTAFAVGFPPCESRAQLPPIAQGLNFFGAPELTVQEQVALDLEVLDREDDRLVFLANVWLDKQATFDSLNTLFLGFEDADMIPPLICFMGNFTSHPCSSNPGEDFASLREGFTALARLIEGYPKIKEGSRLVFVPGPHDPGLGHILPQSRLPKYCTAELEAALPKAIFTTNPCRIKYYNKEVVVFRHELLKAVMRRCLVHPTDLAADDSEQMFAHLALTLLQQSHLCPLPLVVQPVHWMFDHVMQLYPLPHAVVVADSSPQASYKHEGCHVFNPGCLQERLFAAYLPFQDELEPSELPGPVGDTDDGDMDVL